MADDNHIEEWRQIPGRASGYSASSLGRIRRDKRSMGTRTGNMPRQHGGRKYLSVGLSCDGVGFRVDVHRLVAAAFLGPCPPGYEVDHVNGRKRDNRSVNLRYVTHHGNVTAAFALGLIPVGEARCNHKLTSGMVVEIRAAAALGGSFRSIAKRFGIAASTAARVARAETWRHVQ